MDKYQIKFEGENKISIERFRRKGDSFNKYAQTRDFF